MRSFSSKILTATFQSTPSVGRATSSGSLRVQFFRHFNPRPPWGGRLRTSISCGTRTAISIHALRGEGDARFCPPASV